MPSLGGAVAWLNSEPLAPPGWAAFDFAGHTTMRCDRARNYLDRHPNYILAAVMASGT